MIDVADPISSRATSPVPEESNVGATLLPSETPVMTCGAMDAIAAVSAEIENIVTELAPCDRNGRAGKSSKNHGTAVVHARAYKGFPSPEMASKDRE